MPMYDDEMSGGMGMRAAPPPVRGTRRQPQAQPEPTTGGQLRTLAGRQGGGGAEDQSAQLVMQGAQMLMQAGQLNPALEPVIRQSLGILEQGIRGMAGQGGQGGQGGRQQQRQRQPRQASGGGSGSGSAEQF